MKYIFILNIFLCCVLPSKSQSTEDIIRQHIIAIGGEENWSRIHSIEIKSSTKVNGDTWYITKSIIKDSCIRNDIRIEYRRAGRSDKNYYVLINGERGWSYLPEDKNNMILRLYPKEIAEYKENFDYEDPFLNYMEKGHDVQLLNIETIRGHEYYIFEITFRSKKKSIYYINSETLMIDLVKDVGAPDENAKRFHNYTLLPEGIRIPKTILGFSSLITIESILINPIFSDQLFEPSDKNNYSYHH